jgi:hypothetical protein
MDEMGAKPRIQTAMNTNQCYVELTPISKDFE